MKKYFVALVLFFVAILPFSVAAAPNRGSGDLIILDEGARVPSQTPGFLNFLQKSFFINGGGYWSGAGDKKGLTQGFGFVRAGFDYSFNVRGLQQRLYAVGGYSYRTIELGLTYNQRIVLTADEDPPCGERTDIGKCDFTIGVTDKTSGLDSLREAYGSFEIYPDVVLTVGRQRPTWGQFEVFSVVNSVLPIEVQSKEFGVSNTNLRMPQDMAQLRVFLFERIELSGYAFLGTTLDPLLYDVVSRSENYDFYTAPARSSLRPILGDGNDLHNEDKIGFAARALWRGDYLTLGFTYNKGYGSSFGAFNRLPRVERVGTTGNTYNVIPRLILPKTTSYGGELAVPIGNWTIKAEIVYSQSFADIGVRSVDISNLAPECAPTPTSGFDSPERRKCEDDLFQWIVGNNGGKGYVPADTLLAQAGFGADYENWDFGFNILFLQSILSDEGERANELYKLAFPENDSPLEAGGLGGFPVFPTAYVFYNFGQDNQHRIGLVGGFLGITAGVNIFYTGPLYLGVSALDERINWTLSADFSTSLASTLIGEQQDSANGGGGTSPNGVELASAFAASFRAGATFEF